MDFRLSGANPTVKISWGDGKSETFHGNEVSAYHVYPKDESLLFVVEVYIDAEKIDYVDPTGGDCDYELIDFSQAPSIKEILAEKTKGVVIDNSNLEILSLRINLGKKYDLSKCPSLRDLTSQCDSDCESLDLSHSHRLRTISCWGYWSREC